MNTLDDQLVVALPTDADESCPTEVSEPVEHCGAQSIVTVEGKC